MPGRGGMVWVQHSPRVEDTPEIRAPHDRWGGGRLRDLLMAGVQARVSHQLPGSAWRPTW